MNTEFPTQCQVCVSLFLPVWLSRRVMVRMTDAHTLKVRHAVLVQTGSLQSHVHYISYLTQALMLKL